MVAWTQHICAWHVAAKGQTDNYHTSHSKAVSPEAVMLRRAKNREDINVDSLRRYYTTAEAPPLRLHVGKTQQSENADPHPYAATCKIYVYM